MINKLTLNSADYPSLLKEISSVPKQLYHTGAPLADLMKRPRVAIVGTRGVTSYGRQVTIELAKRLAEQGIVIISGLALGVDALAHKAALEVGGLTIAVLPSPIERIAPSTNRKLAQSIVDNGGALVSEYAYDAETFRQNFIARNRIVSGLSDGVLVIEASERSGTQSTVNFAKDQNKLVMAVPGNITSPQSVGTNNLLKDNVTPITNYKDVLYALDLTGHVTPAVAVKGRNAYEQRVLDLMLDGMTDGELLMIKSKLTVIEFNQVLTMLEISSKIRPLGANHWAIY